MSRTKTQQEISQHRRKIVLVLVCVVVMVSLVATTVGNEWILTHGRRIGLWYECTRYDGFCHVPSILKNTGIMKVIKAFMIISCLAAVAGFLVSVYTLCVASESSGKYVSACLFLAVILTLLSLVLFLPNAHKLRRSERSAYAYGWCFVLGWLSFGFALLGAIGALKVGPYHRGMAVLV